MIRNQRGVITVDFVFAIVLIFGFTTLMFLLTFTLSVASITQYVTFAAARNYVVGHIDPAMQQQRGELKYKELTEHPVLIPLFNNGWYSIDATPNIGDHTQINPAYSGAAQGVFNQFWGAGTSFTARVLEIEIPFFGSTAPDSDGTGSGFKTYIGSYLGREPSTEECIQFTAARWEAIKRLPASGGSAYDTGGAGTYFPMTDDGC